MDSLLVVLGFGFICSVIVVANQQEKQKNSDALVKTLLMLIAGIIALIGILSVFSAFSAEPDMPKVEISTASVFAISAILAALFCLGIILSPVFRHFLQSSIIHSDGQTRLYNAHSLVHTTALVLMVFAIINTLGSFLLAGGVAGMAASLRESNISLNDLLLNMLLYITTAFLGIGFTIRRNLWQSLERLGILLPKDGFATIIRHLIVGAVFGFALFWLQVAMSSIWQILVSPETLAEQTAATEQIFQAFSSSIWLGLLVAITTGLGEELLFRGALQPIFGNLLVSLFFVLLHSQYTLTPASFIILVVSLAFGYLRQKYSTSAAIVAHFVYNFSPFVLLYLANQAGVSF
jgi:uncharacterized protein